MQSTIDEIIGVVLTPLLYIISNNKLALILLFAYIILTAVLIFFNPFNLLTNYSQLLFPLIISSGLLNLFLFLTYKFSKNNYKTLRETAIIIFSIIFIFAAIIFLVYILSTHFIKFTFILIATGLLISSLAILYSYFNKKGGTTPTANVSVFQILKALILYLPCLLIDIIEVLKYEYQITTPTIWILLLVEFTFIGLLGLIPFLYKQFSSHDGKTILKGPIYLNNEKDLGSFKMMGIGYEKENNDTKNTKNPIYKYNYAISCWIWINPQPKSTSLAYNEKATLLNYGDVILIKYDNNKFEIYAKTGKHDKVLVYTSEDVLFQKWNNIVINYSGGTLDVFINNKLVISQINIVPVLRNSSVILGQSNGINGGIRDVVYYNNVLSRNKIGTIYNLDNF